MFFVRSGYWSSSSGFLGVLEVFRDGSYRAERAWHFWAVGQEVGRARDVTEKGGRRCVLRIRVRVFNLYIFV